MKQAADKYTVDLFDKATRNRPQLPSNKTSAQLIREYSQRRKFIFLMPGTRCEK